MLMTAAGRAYLTACSVPERKAHLAILKAGTDTLGELSRDRSYVIRVLRQTRSTGYGFNHGEWAREPDFAAVPVSINAGDRVLGAINLVFPKSAITAIELERRFLPGLRGLADEIGRKCLAALEH
jgi:IclR family mhp operon transcriptional activator